MTLCSGRGIWTVEADYPVYHAPRIRWHWGDEIWKEAEGDYKIDSQNKTVSGQRYNVIIWRQDFTREVLTGFSHGPWSPTNNSNFIFINNIPGQIMGFGEYPGFTGPNAGYYLIYSSGFEFWDICRNYQLKDYTYFPDYRSSASTFEIVSIRRIDGEETKEYTLRIYLNNQLVITETGNVSPTVESIPSKCEFNSDWQGVYTETNFIQEAFLKADLLGENVVSLKKCFGYIENLEIKATCEQVATIQGDCNPPKVRGKVEPLCPPNTCEIENCGAQICCYDANGYAVKSY